MTFTCTSASTKSRCQPKLNRYQEKVWSSLLGSLSWNKDLFISTPVFFNRERTCDQSSSLGRISQQCTISVAPNSQPKERFWESEEV